MSTIRTSSIETGPTEAIGRRSASTRRTYAARAVSRGKLVQRSSHSPHKTALATRPCPNDRQRERAQLHKTTAIVAMAASRATMGRFDRPMRRAATPRRSPEPRASGGVTADDALDKLRSSARRAEAPADCAILVVVGIGIGDRDKKTRSPRSRSPPAQRLQSLDRSSACSSPAPVAAQRQIFAIASERLAAHASSAGRAAAGAGGRGRDQPGANACASKRGREDRGNVRRRTSRHPSTDASLASRRIGGRSRRLRPSHAAEKNYTDSSGVGDLELPGKSTPECCPGRNPGM